MTTREAFEAFISAPPFEMPIERFDDRSAWPGGYTELEVDLAWQAWQAALAAPASAPAWHDAPTCAGLWVNMMSGRLIVITEETLEAWQNAAVRWYGPISPDGGQS